MRSTLEVIGWLLLLGVLLILIVGGGAGMLIGTIPMLATTEGKWLLGGCFVSYWAVHHMGKSFQQLNDRLDAQTRRLEQLEELIRAQRTGR